MPGPPQRPSPPHSSPKARRHAPTPPQARPDPIGFPSLASVGSSAPLRALIDPPRTRPAPPRALYGTSPRFPYYFPLHGTPELPQVHGTPCPPQSFPKTHSAPPRALLDISYRLPQSFPRAPYPKGPPTIVDPSTVTNPNYQWGTLVPTWVQAVWAEGVAISNARAATEAAAESTAAQEPHQQDEASTVESIAAEESRRLSRHQQGGASSTPPPAT